MKKIIACFFISLLLFGCATVTENAIDSAIDHYNAGLEKMKQGDYDGAKKEGEKALSKVGTARFNNEGFLPKGPEWNQWLDDNIDKIEPASRCLIAQADYKLGMYDDSLKEADAVIKYCNANSTWNGKCSESYQCAIYYRGGAYFTKKNYPAAEKDFLWLRDSGAERLREEATLFLAATYANQGKYNAAIAEADKVIRMHGAYTGKAVALKQQVHRMRSGK